MLPNYGQMAGFIPGMGSANERRHYSLILNNRIYTGIYFEKIFRPIWPYLSLYVYLKFTIPPYTDFIQVYTRGVTIRLATIRYISRYTTHDMVHDTIQNQLIYYQWKIWKHCGMCHQYFYIKTVILARNSEFKINKDVHNHPCPKYLLLTNCVCKQNNKIS